MKLLLRDAPDLRLDLRALAPGAADWARVPVGIGREAAVLGDFFTVFDDGDGQTVHLEGDLSRCDRIGWQLAAGRIVAHGDVGDHAGALMTGGELAIDGSAAHNAGCEMAGGRLVVAGHVGDHAAGALPGSLDGMRGGEFVIGGDAGARLGDRMRRGTVVVHGQAGDFLASRMVAGTIALAGRAGAHAGYGQRRGSVVFAGPHPQPPITHVAAGADAPVFWQLLARDLARHGGAFATLPARRITRLLGDLTADGKGELVLVEPA